MLTIPALPEFGGLRRCEPALLDPPLRERRMVFTLICTVAHAALRLCLPPLPARRRGWPVHPPTPAFLSRSHDDIVDARLEAPSKSSERTVVRLICGSSPSASALDAAHAVSASAAERCQLVHARVQLPAFCPPKSFNRCGVQGERWQRLSSANNHLRLFRARRSTRVSICPSREATFVDLPPSIRAKGNDGWRPRARVGVLRAATE